MVKQCIQCGTNPVTSFKELHCSLQCKLLFFVEKQENGCWHWKKKSADEYGKLWWRKRCYPAHRLSFKIFKGDIPAAYCVKQTCHTRLCINPDHLVTVKRALSHIQEHVKKTETPQWWATWWLAILLKIIKTPFINLLCYKK